MERFAATNFVGVSLAINATNTAEFTARKPYLPDMHPDPSAVRYRRALSATAMTNQPCLQTSPETHSVIMRYLPAPARRATHAKCSEMVSFP